ncbi:hypothetical protein NPIL_362901 [Nephila pilipes]|uniref:C2H2-type domain-containing protein n=1 Tax=Nephila pilipes TaxID=299642 RepID=A0A8X6P3L6_NEPPI|nr:hypothetical protein NPIL_362901 [Nephila pilipes]
MAEGGFMPKLSLFVAEKTKVVRICKICKEKEECSGIKNEYIEMLPWRSDQCHSCGVPSYSMYERTKKSNSSKHEKKLKNSEAQETLARQSNVCPICDEVCINRSHLFKHLEFRLHKMRK